VSSRGAGVVGGAGLVVGGEAAAGAPETGAASAGGTPRRPRVVAHRGASGLAPENTLAAFRQAWALGCEAIELDVHLSADGHVVVIHDQSLARTAGSPRLVQECTLEELRGFEVGSWKHPDFGGERIATLAEVIGAAPAGSTVFVEVKTPAAALPRIVEELRRLVDEHPEVAVALQSFDVGVLTQLAAGLPGVTAYWTVGAPRQSDGTITAYPAVVLERARELGLAGVALDARGVQPELLSAAGAVGLLVDVWTVNDAAALRDWLARPEVRWVETDRPELVDAS
jgi:glycerophosphoryl diester phosphodiesterase